MKKWLKSNETPGSAPGPGIYRFVANGMMSCGQGDNYAGGECGLIEGHREVISGVVETDILYHFT